MMNIRLEKSQIYGNMTYSTLKFNTRTSFVHSIIYRGNWAPAG